MANFNYNSRDYKLGRFIELCFRIASWIDAKSEAGESFTLDEFGLGHLAMSNCLRSGICEVIQLESDLHCAMNRERVAKLGEEDVTDFLEEIFGDRNIDSINDKDKERIKEFVKKIEAEWEDE